MTERPSPPDDFAPPRRRVVYLINGFDAGGAEHGLLTLIRSGFFAGCELRIVAFCIGNPALAAQIRQSVGEDNLIVARATRQLTLTGMMLGALQLATLIRRFRPHSVVASLKQANIVGRIVLSLFPSVECISFEHIERYRARRYERLYAALLKLISRRVDSVWADSLATLDSTRHYFSRPELPGHVVPLFCVRDDVDGKSSWTPASPLRIVAAGRLIARKNMQVAIDTIGRLGQQGIDARLTLYGDGPERERLQQHALESGCADRVHFAGHVERWFEAARDHDVFLNLSDTEGFCIVVAEALSMGLPAICTDVGGIRQYGRHGHNMIKIADPSADALAQAVIDLTSAPGTMRRIGVTARADMRQAFSADTIRRRGLELLPAATPVAQKHGKTGLAL